MSIWSKTLILRVAGTPLVMAVTKFAMSVVPSVMRVCFSPATPAIWPTLAYIAPFGSSPMLSSSSKSCVSVWNASCQNAPFICARTGK